jgi:hypothetical protein
MNYPNKKQFTQICGGSLITAVPQKYPYLFRLNKSICSYKDRKYTLPLVEFRA